MSSALTTPICHIYCFFARRLKRKGPAKPYTFFINGDANVNVIKTYMELHSDDKKVGRFLKKVNENGKATQNIGRNSLGLMPQKIAEYLKIPDADKFSGHTFRRTGATILADSGCQMMTLKRAGITFYDCLMLRLLLCMNA